MWRKLIIIVSIIVLFLAAGCAPPKFIPRDPLKVEFKPTPPYEINLDKIPKPEKLKPVFVNEKFEEVPKDQAKFIVLDPENYAKIAALLKLAKAYKNIIKEQEVLVNAHIQLINALKEYLKLEGGLEDIEGFKIPDWLPYKYASDQASLLVVCLVNYYNITKDDSILEYIKRLADGIMQMQVEEKESEYCT